MGDRRQQHYTTDQFVFFWGTNTPNGEFSQWHPCEFEDEDGWRYNCAEQYMMAQKARLFGDDDAFHKIMGLTSPKAIKDMGRKIRNFDQETWDKYKFDIVVKGNFLKFAQNKPLLERLVLTGGRTIAEASPVDCIWGIGMSVRDDGLLNQENWRGENLLGKALMEVRSQLLKG